MRSALRLPESSRWVAGGKADAAGREGAVAGGGEGEGAERDNGLKRASDSDGMSRLLSSVVSDVVGPRVSRGVQLRVSCLGCHGGRAPVA